MGRLSTKQEKTKELILYNQFGRPVEKKDTSKKAFSIPFFKDGEGWKNNLFYRTSIEAGRLQILRDMDAMLNTFLDAPANYMCAWLTATMPDISFTGNGGKKAERIVLEMLERTRYEEHRAEYLYNGIFKEEFIYLEIDYEAEILGYLALGRIDKIIKAVSEGKSMGKIAGLKHLPASYTFKHFDAYDEPINAKRAYFQVKDGYLGLMGDDPPPNSLYMPNINIIHPRWKNLRYSNVWYSRPAFFTAREQFNRAQLMLEDMVLDSHYSMTPILAFLIKANGDHLGAEKEEIEAFKDSILGKQNENWENIVSAGGMLFLSGTDEVRMINDQRIYSIRQADTNVHLELLFLNTMFPVALAGYIGGKGSLNGETLDIIKKHGELMVGEGNRYEWNKILRPLIERELLLHGIAGINIKPKYHQTTFDSRSVEEKINASRVANFTLSRESAFEGVEADSWKDEQKRIMTEIKNFRNKDIDIIPYKEDEKMQDLDKGAKGSPKDGAQTPVTKQEGFSDDRKQEKNIKGGD